ncbi:MAG: DUF1080 domain-containing protein [Balneolales bacterium]
MLLLTMVLVSCTSAQQTQQVVSSEQQDEIAEIITQLPAYDQDEQYWLHERLMDMGTAGISTLASQLVADGTGDDTYARFALNGLAKHVTRPEADNERSVYENALLDELKKGRSDLVKIFLMEQLEMTGSDNAIPVLETFLTDNILFEPAVEALVAIQSEEAVQVVRQELSGAEGDRLATFIKALGDMQHSSAVQDIVPYADSDNWQIKRATLYALAEIGHPQGSEAISQAAASLNSTQQNTARSYYLAFAQRLADEGHVTESSQIARQVLAGNFPLNFKSSALYTLTQNEGIQALEDLLAAAQSSNKKYREAALALAGALPGQEVTQAFVTNLERSNTQVKADIITMLGNRGDHSALSALMPLLSDNNTAIRQAAIQSVASLGDSEVIAELFEALDNARQPEEIQTVKNSLLQISPNALLPAASSAYQSAPDHSKITFIEIFAERGASGYLYVILNQHEFYSSKVRLAIYQSLNNLATPTDLAHIIRLLPEAQNNDELEAIQQAIVSISNDIQEREKRADAVLKAFNGASVSNKPQLLEMLPYIGGQKALNEVEAAAFSSYNTIQSSAILALSEWQEVTAIPVLLNILDEAEPEQRQNVLERYVRLVTGSGESASEKIQLLQDAVMATNGTQEKETVLAAFSEVNDPVALKAIAGYLNDNDETIRQEAISVAARLLSPSYEPSSGSFNSTYATLTLLEGSVGQETKNQIQRQVAAMNATRDMETGFVSLFNGQDLSGWTGDTDAYKVEDGQIMSRPGTAGNLFTEQEYSNFNLQFEFKLTEGANNGIGIRAPLEGNAAYDGMELQVLDNDAEKYANLEEYQYHGSVYGVSAAKRGFLKPVGEWNSQEVIARDSQITVILNDETILETDIKEASTPNTIDGREHPGLLNESGHIGFLGHGDEVAYRNLVLQDLDTYSPVYDIDSDESDAPGTVRRSPATVTQLFNGENLAGWERVGMEDGGWYADDGILFTEGRGEEWQMGGGGVWLSTENTYDNFILELEYRIPEGGNSGVFLRAPREGDPAFQGIEIQLLDDYSDDYAGLNPWQYTGSIYDVKAPSKQASKPAGEWQKMVIRADGPSIAVTLNGERIINSNLINHMHRIEEHPGLKRRAGYIGLQNHNTRSEFRNIKITELE